MRTDPERVSLDLIGRKLAEVSDEELAALVGAERLVAALNASDVEGVGVCPACALVTLPWACCNDGIACNCCPNDRCGA